MQHPSPINYRPDIDGLRAIAVVSVVLYHAFPEWMRGGFIGVDVFFVISGFLISSIIFRDLEKNSFSTADFYGRRIRRIFPSLVVVLLATYTVGWFCLFQDEFQQLGKQIAAGAGFVSNFVLWSESGYFDSSAETKPLLHLWSLAIEEQFYILWPLLLAATWGRRSRTLWTIVAIAILSFSWSLFRTQTNATAAFYSPESRFWELSIGAILAYLTTYDLRGEKRAAPVMGQFGRYQDALSFVGLSVLLFGLVWIFEHKPFPGYRALLPTLGTAMIIAAGSSSWINRRILSHRLLVGIGLISFPLYLWHWPLLSFARIIGGAPPPPSVAALAIITSLGLAWGTHRWIEKPLRFGHHTKKKTFALISAVALLGGVGLLTDRLGGLRNRSFPSRHHDLTESLSWPYWDDDDCSERFGMSPCQVSGYPLKVMILGDSHANHLYPGIAAAAGGGVIAAGTCPPLQEVSVHVSRHQAEHPCARRDYLAENLKILANHPTIDTVIISSFWNPILTGTLRNSRERVHWGDISLVSEDEKENRQTPLEIVFQGLSRTISRLESMGKKVVFVGDAPDLKSDFRVYCLHGRRRTTDSHQDCVEPKWEIEKSNGTTEQLIDALTSRFPELGIFRPSDVLCDANSCFYMKDGQPLYRDEHHFSIEGSKRIGREIARRFLSQ